MSTTKEQLTAGLNTLRALADTIRELGEVPSGHLYASVMGAIDLQGYQKAIALLVKSGIVRQCGDVLVWNVREEPQVAA
jgi:hypothetical protein